MRTVQPTPVVLITTVLSFAPTTAGAVGISVTGGTDSAAPAGATDCSTAGCTWDAGSSEWDCPSLRKAVECSNLTAGRDVIGFDSSVSTCALTIVGEDDANDYGDLDITDDVEIIGRGRLTTIIDAGGLSTGGPAYTDRAIQILGSSGSMPGVTLRELQVRNGWDHYNGIHPTGGGCIRNQGALVLDDVIVYNGTSEAIYVGQGDGGIWSAAWASLRVKGSLIDTNVAEESWGGGILAFGDLVVDDSLVARNEAQAGGGIYAAGDLEIVDSDLGNNTAHFVGGGLFIDNEGSYTASIHHASFTENGQDLAPWPPTVWRGGGAIAARNEAVATFENVTVSSNIALAYGGGVYTFTSSPGVAAPTLDFSFTTVADNYSSARVAADGLSCSTAGGGSCGFEESIVDDRCWSGVAASGENLDGTGGTCSFSITAAAGLLSLDTAANGTLIHHLDTGLPSPALDAATTGSCPDDDQEGDARTDPCDLGADES